MAEHAEEEQFEELPAWSLPAGACDRIALQSICPEAVTREWAWGGSTGKDVSVCILDSGVERGHPLVGEIQSAVAVSAGDGGEALVTEDAEGGLRGHGTACAGVIRGLGADCGLPRVRVLGRGVNGH